MKRERNPKICIVSSCGGHLTEVRCLLPAYETLEHFYVLNDKAILPADMRGRTYFITHAERDWRVLKNFLEAWTILRRERPDAILSTGAGPVVPFAILCRTVYPCTVIFVETITRVSSPSLTGRIMYLLAHHFYYQWPTLRSYFPHGEFRGTLI